MTHEQAVETRAVERYVLEEMTAEQTKDFEEHYFDCPECAAELATSTLFVENTRVFLGETPTGLEDPNKK